MQTALKSAAPDQPPAISLLLNLDQVRNFSDHSADSRRILKFDGLAHLVQAQADQRGSLLFGTPIGLPICVTLIVFAAMD